MNLLEAVVALEQNMTEMGLNNRVRIQLDKDSYLKLCSQASETYQIQYTGTPSHKELGKGDVVELRISNTVFFSQL